MLSGKAEQLLKDPDLVALFDQLERQSLESAINAKIGDDEARRNFLGEVRAIRSVRQKLALAASKAINLHGDTGE